MRRKRDRERARERESLVLSDFHQMFSHILHSFVHAHTYTRVQRCCIASKTVTTMLYRPQDRYNDVVSPSRLVQRWCIGGYYNAIASCSRIGEKEIKKRPREKREEKKDQEKKEKMEIAKEKRQRKSERKRKLGFA